MPPLIVGVRPELEDSEKVSEGLMCGWPRLQAPAGLTCASCRRSSPLRAARQVIDKLPCTAIVAMVLERLQRRLLWSACQW